MKSTRLISFVLCTALSFGAALSAQESSDPLRLVPGQANLALKIEQPSRVVTALYEHEIVQDWLKIDGVRDLYDTTNFRRLLQLREYFEKKLGVSGMELLERLTGGGVVLAVKAGEPGNILLVVRGKDEVLLKKFVETAIEVLKQEYARQEIKEKVEPVKFDKFDAYNLGKAVLAVHGSTLLVCSDPNILHASLELAEKDLAKKDDMKGDKKGGGKKKKKDAPAEAKANGSLADNPNMKDARKLLPKETLAWAWVDLESVRKIKGFKDGYDAVNGDTLFFFGGIVDLVGRSPFVLAHVSQEGQNFGLEVRMPRGREGMNERAALFMPADEKASLPLLAPPHVLASVSYYLDLKTLWENIYKVLGNKAAMDLEGFDLYSGRFTGGTKLSTLLAQAGRHQRIVVAQSHKSPYNVKPQQPIPAFALVQEMRDPEFARSMETVLRAGGLLASFQYNLKLVDEEHGPYKIVSYRFNEKKPLAGDDANFRFNFSPSFCVVGDQLIVSSTAELAHDLIDQVLESKSAKSAPSSTRIALFAKGGAEALRAGRDALLAQAILNQALPPEEAGKQLDALINLAERLGALRLEIEYGQNDFRYTIRFQYK